MKKKYLFLSFLVFSLFLISFVSSAHYIFGAANDALDGTQADDNLVVLWNPSVGTQDNLTDIIGVNGNSFTENYYMIDCELLQTPCSIGDNLSVRIIDTSGNFLSHVVNGTVTSAGFDAFDNLTMNSAPNSTLLFPDFYAYLNSSSVLFNCSASDLDSNLYSLSLYGNWTGGWALNETKFISGGENSSTFSKILSEGTYMWDCKAEDDLGFSSFSNSARVFTLDLTPPSISSFYSNESGGCSSVGVKMFRVICETDDSSGLKNVSLGVNNDLGTFNYSLSLLSGNQYFRDINVDTYGAWDLNCFSEDLAGNKNSSSFSLNFIEKSLPDFKLLNFYVNESLPVEKEQILLISEVLNGGCSSGNLSVSFYNHKNGLVFINKTSNYTLLASQKTNVSIDWITEIGNNLFEAIADAQNSVEEYNESNNNFNYTFDVTSWQDFYGNFSGFTILSKGSNEDLLKWNNSGSFGKIFVADKESDVDWLNLAALGVNTSGGDSLDDFSEVDSLLGMSSFEDSISKEFLENEHPKLRKDLQIYGRLIKNVSLIDSGTKDTFFTGILWDSSDDLGGNGFDISDKEDLVFVGTINKSQEGDYGVQDYHIKIPVKLRSYDEPDEKEVYFYYELL